MKICIIGASKGLGITLVHECMRQSHTIWAVARSLEPLQHLAHQYGADRFHYTVADISDTKAVANVVRSMVNESFIPDVVILVASVLLDDLGDDGYDEARGREMMMVNLLGTLSCIGVLLPLMIKNGGGTMTAIASASALRPSVRSAAYSASKAGIAIAMRSFNLSYTSKGMMFKTVFMGPIQTTMWEGRRSVLVPTAEKAAQRILRFALGRGRRLYYPFLTTSLLRLSRWLPDAVFAAATKRFLK